MSYAFSFGFTITAEIGEGNYFYRSRPTVFISLTSLKTSPLIAKPSKVSVKTAMSTFYFLS